MFPGTALYVSLLQGDLVPADRNVRNHDLHTTFLEQSQPGQVRTGQMRAGKGNFLLFLLPSVGAQEHRPLHPA